MPGTAGTAHLECALPRELEHLPVQQEEAAQAEPGDQPQLAVEPLTCPALVPVRIRVALGERAVADLPQLYVGGIGTVGEVGVPIAELLREIEPAAVGDFTRAQCCIVRQSLEHCGRGEQHRLVVASPFALAALQRRAMANRDERILQLGAALMVRVHVPRRDSRHSKMLGELLQLRVTTRVAALERPLQLDVERVTKRRRDAGSCGCIARRQPMPRTAGQAHEPFRMRGDVLDRRRRRQELPMLLSLGTRSGMGVREDAAEVRVAALRLAEQRQMCASFDRQLGAGDRTDTEVFRRVCELERAVHPVVVGERECVVAQLCRSRRQLFGQRRAVEERVGRVCVQLDVRRRIGAWHLGARHRIETPLVAHTAAGRKGIARGERHTIPPWTRSSAGPATASVSSAATARS